MTTTVDAIRNQLETTVRAITPTAKAPSGITRFTLVGDDNAGIGEESAHEGMERTFEVWIGADEEGSIDGHGERAVITAFLVVVKYPWSDNLRELDALAAMDRADIKNAVEQTSNWLANDMLHVAVPESEQVTRVVGKQFLSGVSVRVEYLIARGY